MFGSNAFGWPYPGQGYAETADGIAAPFIGSSTTLYAPTVSGSGAATISAPFISSTTTLYTPTSNVLVAWDYDGASTLTATLSPVVPGNDYVLQGLAFSTVTDTAVTSSLTLTATDVGTLDDTEQFAAWVFSADDREVFDANVFAYGDASTTGVGIPVTWTYDGSNTVDVSFITSAADDYSVEFLFYSGAGSINDVGSDTFSGPGTVGTIYDLTTGGIGAPTVGSSFVAILWDNQGGSVFSWRAIAARVFIGGSASSGFPGSPITGGTDIGIEGGGTGEPLGAGGVRVSIAFDDGTLEPTPTWTDITAISPNLVASFSIDRGRAYELDRTDTGTATVRINDRDGVLDPMNAFGPYYGLLEPRLQIKLDLWNPAAEEWSTLYRGYIEDFDYEIQPWIHQNQDGDTVGVLTLEIGCVDAFAILTAIEMQPDLTFGTSPPAESEGNIYFASAPVDDRITEVLGDAGWPAALYTVFSGNVQVQNTVYSPSENVLQVVQDAADAEFPGVGNVYTSRLGIVTFHGRLAKFDPEGVSADAGDAWPFHHWKAGDEKAVLADVAGETAQIRELSVNRGWSKIINKALATPTGIADADIAGQVSSDSGSIATYGIQSWSAENLMTDGGLYDGLDGLEETKLFADYYVAVYSHPQNRINNLTFRSINKDDYRAEATWALLCGAEISDLIDVTVTTPGEGGFNLEPFFIEGVHYEVGPLNGEYADVTLTLDLSPRSYYPGGTFGVFSDSESSELAVHVTGAPYEDYTLTAEATGGV